MTFFELVKYDPNEINIIPKDGEDGEDGEN